MAVDLPGNHRSLNARQNLLRFRQGQSQVRDIDKTFRPADLHRSALGQRSSSPVAINRNTHRIRVPPAGYRPDRAYLSCANTLDTPPVTLSRTDPALFMV
jgi:hypothetical protein